jgi:hypothetical protein
MNQNPESSKPLVAQGQNCATPRWFALINDRIFTAPRQKIPVSLLRALASVPSDHALIRDLQSPTDELLEESTEVNLAEGNVFYTRPKSEVTKAGTCHSPSKMALAVDDRFETIVSLFGLPEGTQLIRDFESPHDQPIQSGSLVDFADGPTFLSHSQEQHHIDVAIITTAGAFPEEGFERLSINQPIKVQLSRAVAALKIKDTTDWIATHGTRELALGKSYAENGLSGQVTITYGKREGGGGAAQ